MSKKPKKRVLVALGASAGGMEALSGFIRHLKAGTGFSYIVAQHLSPDSTSLLTELLSRLTSLPVDVVDADVKPEPDHIYITPPNHDIVYEQGKLTLRPPSEKIGPKPSINRMLHSMAAAEGILPVGIILSGTGTDGVSGMVALKSAGGLTLAQEPSSSKYNGMPLASISAEVVDHILEPTEMARQLPGLVENRLKHGSVPTEKTAYYRIISAARSQSGLDLTNYKPATIERRIERRRLETHCDSMNAYAEYLSNHKEEVETFVREVLIPVTSFFRDQECFEALKSHLVEVINGLGRNEVFRAWVPGCATGEEAYSIAMLLEDIAREKDIQLQYQMFATDLDDQALQTARQGTYQLDELTAVSKSYLNRYFEVQGDSARVNARIRDRITFSKHNLIQDPPFSRLHLVSCRNLLIYFNTVLQSHVYDLFHYALGEGGLLFLGKSESINDSGQFSTVDRQHRIHRSNSLSKAMNRLPFMHFSPTYGPNENRPKPSQKPERDLEPLVNKAVAQSIASAMIVVNASDSVIYVSELARNILRFTTNNPSLTVYDLIPAPIRAELKAQLYKVRRDRTPSTSGTHIVEIDHETRSLQLQLMPLTPNNFEKIVIVLTENDVETQPLAQDDEHSEKQYQMVTQLQHELSATRESLQTVIEELETSNEELQATNEELQSTNEELQSANEELQTTNEELQSTNEELLTVNDEVLQKNQQLEQLNTEFENLYKSSGIPYLIVDREFLIQRIHSDLEPLLKEFRIDVGMHIAQLQWREPIPHLQDNLKDTLENGATHQSYFKVRGCHYRVVIRPYFVNRSDIAGAVMSFIDITELEKKQEALDHINRDLTDILNVSPDGIVTINSEGKIVSFSQQAAKMFGYRVEEAVGQPIEILMPEEHAKQHARYLDNYYRTGVRHIIGLPRRMKAKHKDGHFIPVELHVAEFENPQGNMRFIGVLRDISHLLDMETQLKEHQVNASVTLDHIDDGVMRIDSDWKILYANRESERWLESSTLEQLSLFDAMPLYDEITQLPIDYKSLDLDSHESHLGVLKHGKHRSLIEFRLYWLDDQDSQDRQKLLVFRDVTQKETSARQIEWESRHDPLTGLLNRNQLLIHMDDLLARMSAQTRSHTLLFIDLDQFKIVNDSSGHEAGDELLRQLANQLQRFIRSRDMLARLGGDEFAVLMENCPIERAEHIADGIIQMIRDFRFSYDGKLYRIGASIGLTLLKQGQTSRQVLSSADHACYAAKEMGRNRYAIAEPGGEIDTTRDLSHIGSITDALDNSAFELYFQEIRSVKAGSGKPMWEALVRLRGQDGQLVEPGSFIPVAERFNHMHHVDLWVVDRLVTLINSLVDQLGLEHAPHVSFNISGQTISQPGMKKAFLKKLSTVKVPLTHFCVEITETSAITNFTHTRDVLWELSRKGCKIALDDFGSGMASFNYIRQIPIDVIKIDSNIIKDIDEDLLDLTIVQCIQHIAEVLDCQTIAEGVESALAEKRLRSIGVDCMQGFFLHKPVGTEEWLKALGASSEPTDI